MHLNPPKPFKDFPMKNLFHILLIAQLLCSLELFAQNPDTIYVRPDMNNKFMYDKGKHFFCFDETFHLIEQDSFKLNDCLDSIIHNTYTDDGTGLKTTHKKVFHNGYIANQRVENTGLNVKTRLKEYVYTLTTTPGLTKIQRFDQNWNSNTNDYDTIYKDTALMSYDDSITDLGKVIKFYHAYSLGYGTTRLSKTVSTDKNNKVFGYKRM